MRFDIKCSTFIRLASICNFFEPETTAEVREEINTLRLEARDGKLFAICTNQRIAAVEYIAQVDPNLNEVAHIILNPALIAQCKAEAFFDGMLTINTIPAIASAMATTSTGWSMHNCCYWYDESLLDEWRKWFPSETPKKSDGIMIWNLALVQALFESSPTGKIIFPRHIDANKPLVLRDAANPFWVGAFIPAPWGSTNKVAAELPEWWNN